jgi:hypothetical protein
VPEKAKCSIGKIDNGSDYDQGYNPVAKFIEHSQPGADKQLYKVVARPRYDITDSETSGARKARLCGGD